MKEVPADGVQILERCR